MSATYKILPTSCCQDEIHMQRKLLRIISVDFDATGQLLTIYFAFVKYLRKNEAAHHPFVDIKKTHDSKRMVLNNVLTEFGIPTKFEKLIKCD